MPNQKTAPDCTARMFWISGKNCSGKTQLVLRKLGCRKYRGFYTQKPTNGPRVDLEIGGNLVFVYGFVSPLDVSRVNTITTELKKLESNLSRALVSYQDQVARYVENEEKKKTREKLEQKICHPTRTNTRILRGGIDFCQKLSNNGSL